MTGARFAPQATYLEPLLGWRFWRVQPIQTLSQGTRFRLCAAGGNGRPKVWQPRAATVAACSDRTTRHDAPHPRHGCGIYAYRERDDMESRLAFMVAYERHVTPTNPARSRPTYDTWAVGRVQLWGRVVECELGWRAQFAYPYELTVFSNGTAPRVVAADYAVEAEREHPRRLTELLKRYPDAVARGKNDSSYKKWYAETIHGVMDRTFLRPYHDEVMGRLAAIELQLARLSSVALKEQGEGSDDA